MPSRGFYDFLYRVGAPWGSSPRAELVQLVENGTLRPQTHPRVIDLGCGEGEDSIFLASKGFDVTGVDFSERAVRMASAKAERRNLASRARFLTGDLTASELPGVEAPFDVLVDGGSLDDLQGEARRAAARTVLRLSRPGSVFFMWCFFAARSQLPWISFTGPSRLAPGFEPGEVERLFGHAFTTRRMDEPGHTGRWAAFLMVRRDPSDEPGGV